MRIAASLNHVHVLRSLILRTLIKTCITNSTSLPNVNVVSNAVSARMNHTTTHPTLLLNVFTLCHYSNFNLNLFVRSGSNLHVRPATTIGSGSWPTSHPRVNLFVGRRGIVQSHLANALSIPSRLRNTTIFPPASAPRSTTSLVSIRR